MKLIVGQQKQNISLESSSKGNKQILEISFHIRQCLMSYDHSRMYKCTQDFFKCSIVLSGIFRDIFEEL